VFVCALACGVGCGILVIHESVCIAIKVSFELASGACGYYQGIMGACVDIVVCMIYACVIYV
jgi:hypothetical protein